MTEPKPQFKVIRNPDWEGPGDLDRVPFVLAHAETGEIVLSRGLEIAANVDCLLEVRVTLRAPYVEIDGWDPAEGAK